MECQEQVKHAIAKAGEAVQPSCRDGRLEAGNGTGFTGLQRLLLVLFSA